jgi:hypothetical protein
VLRVSGAVEAPPLARVRCARMRADERTAARAAVAVEEKLGHEKLVHEDRSDGVRDCTVRVRCR